MLSSWILEIAYAESGIRINQVANLTKKVILPLEKQTPHCRLSVVKALVTSGKIRATASAYRGALELGISDLDGIAEVVLSLTSRDFHKSMTTHLDHQIWQDVYRTKIEGTAMVYLKLTVIEEVLIVSFKER